MTTLELGSGNHPTDGAVHHDITKHADYIDVAHDLDVFPWPFLDESFDKILALDVMEHLKSDVRDWLNECHRILKPEGTLVLRLPAWDAENSYIDPTHHKLFHEKTFSYWDERSFYYQNYGQFYFPEHKLWYIESIERRDNGSNIGYVMRKA